MNKKILIVEDEKPLARVLSLKLNSAGYQVVIAYDGKEALAILSKQTFDLIILDLIMPKEDGFQVLQKIKDMGIKMPIIVSSNLSQIEDVKRAKQLGALDYFVKSDTTLVNVVEKVKQYLK